MRQPPKPIIKTVRFTNWTDEDFTHTWDSVLYEFKAGETIMLMDYLARHFAKHLVTRELNKKNLQANDPIRQEMEAKCFGLSVEHVNEEKARVEMANKNIKPAGTNTLKAKRSRKEEEFEGLKDEK